MAALEDKSIWEDGEELNEEVLRVSNDEIPDHLEDGISFLWKQISVHGISSATPAKCIYFMLDHQLTWPGIYEVTAASPYINIQNGVEDEANATDEEQNDDEIFQDVEEEQITECWLIPDDVNTVDTIFQAMTERQA
uniref:Uncharacterized protein n=1 Tax=Glossina austeni TaxID=7395 RepID=A0A1A9UNS4_GLOAU